MVVDYNAHVVIDKVFSRCASGAQPLIPNTFPTAWALLRSQDILGCSLLDNSVSVYSMPTLHRLSTIPVGKGPDWLTFTPDGARCYVSNAGADSVSAIDVASRKELIRIPVGKVPKRIIAVALP